MTAILAAATAGVFGLLAELLRRSGRDKAAHADMDAKLTDLGELVKDARRDVGGLRGDVRALTARVDRLDQQLDTHLERSEP